MVDIFTEIQEDLRRDRMTAIWARWGILIVAALVGLVLVVAVVVGWREWQSRRNVASSATYSEAMLAAESGDSEKALGALDTLRDKGGYGVLARLRAAALLAEKGDRTAAVGAYDSVANDGGVDAIYRDLALLRSVLLQIDEGDTAALIARLAPLMAATSSWRPSATEMTALLERRAGNVGKARTLFKELSEDPAAPSSLRQRAGDLLATFAPKAG